MKTIEKMPLRKLLIGLWGHIEPHRRKQFFLLLFLMMIASVAEMFSIGAIIPFLAVLTAPERVFEHAFAQPVVSHFQLTSPGQLLLPLTVIFGTAAIVAGSMRLLLLWTSTRLSFAAGADLSLNIYQRTLHQPYSVHIARSSSEVISGIAGKSDAVIYNNILPILTMVSSAFMLTGILGALISVEPTVTIATFGGLGVIYASIIRITRKRLDKDSACIAAESTNVIKALQEGLGGIRDVLLDGSQATYCEVYRRADLPLRRAQGNWQVIGASPRFGMEALGMMLIAVMAYVFAQETDGLVEGIPVLGALALGAQRLLPILQQTYAAWTSVRGGQASLKDIIELLSQPMPVNDDNTERSSISFERKISLNGVSFRYSDDDREVLCDLSLDIEKGSTIGFIGTTGSGKSTLLDIVMGLLDPSTGSLQIDDITIVAENLRDWQSKIAHVPQSIFLCDGSIAENIAFGIPPHLINNEKVKEAATFAQLSEVIEAMPEKYQTGVGERGVKLSGGQRQRIGIARALYKGADVIIFDEATSALDSKTEDAVMKAINIVGERLTILIIAHRTTTLRNCSRIVELDGGSIRRIVPYKDYLSSDTSII